MLRNPEPLLCCFLLQEGQVQMPPACLGAYCQQLSPLFNLDCPSSSPGEAEALTSEERHGVGKGRCCRPHLALPKVVMGLFLNLGRKYLLFTAQENPRAAGVFFQGTALNPARHGK